MVSNDSPSGGPPSAAWASAVESLPSSLRGILPAEALRVVGTRRRSSVGLCRRLGLVGSAAETEGRIPVGDEHERVGLNPERPSQDADEEVMEGAGVAAGEEHYEPTDQAEDDYGDV